VDLAFSRAGLRCFRGRIVGFRNALSGSTWGTRTWVNTNSSTICLSGVVKVTFSGTAVTWYGQNS